MAAFSSANPGRSFNNPPVEKQGMVVISSKENGKNGNKIVCW
jgi:hypothetical protein